MKLLITLFVVSFPFAASAQEKTPFNQVVDEAVKIAGYRLVLAPDQAWLPDTEVTEAEEAVSMQERIATAAHQVGYDCTIIEFLKIVYVYANSSANRSSHVCLSANEMVAKVQSGAVQAPAANPSQTAPPQQQDQPVAPATTQPATATTTPAPKQNAPIEGATAAAVHVPPIGGYNMYNVPAAYSPELGVSEQEWFLARSRPPREIIYPSLNYGYGNYGAAYGVGYQVGYGFGGPLEAELWRRHQIQNEKGLLGFTCEDGDLCKHALLYLDGCLRSSISELLKGPFKGKLPLDRGGRQITIIGRVDGVQKYFQDVIEIEPRAVGQAVGGEKYTNLKVSKDLLNQVGVPQLPACRP